MFFITFTTSDIDKRLTDIESLLQQLLAKEQAMTQEFDDLAAEVTQIDTVTESVLTLITGLVAKVNALGDAPTPEQLKALRDSLEADRQKLADAVTANTTPAPTA